MVLFPDDEEIPNSRTQNSPNSLLFSVKAIELYVYIRWERLIAIEDCDLRDMLKEWAGEILAERREWRDWVLYYRICHSLARLLMSISFRGRS
jgi:hypothetical protein